MIRIFARRPLLFCALAICAGAGIVIAGYYADSVLGFIITMIVLCLVTCFAFLVEFLPAKTPSGTRFYKFCATNRLLFLSILVAFIAGGLLCDAKLTSFEDVIDSETQYYVTGSVDTITEYSTSVSLILSDVTLQDGDLMRKLAGKTSIKLKGDVIGEIQKGDIIGFTTLTFESNSQRDEKLNSYEIVKDIHYSGTATIGDDNALSFFGSRNNAADIVHDQVLAHLLNQMPQEIAHLSYSVLFGDSSYLSEMTNTSFKISGVMHIVAVSGMNVAFIIAIVLGCLKFLKRKRLLKFCISAAVLVFYCYLCDYTPSVVRATIMGLILLSARSLGRQPDIMSSLGLACIIIMCIWPMSILDAGFLLSFACVVGIAFFARPINDFLHIRLKMPNWLASGIAMTVASQIGIYPIMAEYFNSFSMYSLLANIVVVPVFSLAYILLFACLLIVLVLPFMEFILVIPAIPMAFVYWFPSIFVNLPLASVYVFEMGTFTVLYYVIIVLISSFIFISSDYHNMISIILLTGLVCALILTNVPKVYKTDTVTRLCDDCYLITTSSNEKLLLGVAGSYEAESYAETIQRKRIDTLDAVIMFDLTNDPYEDREVVEFLQTKFAVKQIVVDESAKYAYNSLLTKPQNGVTCVGADGLQFDGATLNRLYWDDKLLVTLLTLSEFSIAVIPDGLNPLDLTYARAAIPLNSYFHYTDESYENYFYGERRLNDPKADIEGNNLESKQVRLASRKIAYNY